MSGIVAIAELVRLDRAPRAFHRSAPLRERKFIECGHAGTKRRGVVRAAALARQPGDTMRQTVRGCVYAAAGRGERRARAAHHADDGTMPARGDEAFFG